MIKQRTPEWFAQRKGRVTGSVVGAILGNNPWQTKEDVLRAMVREHHGAPREFTGNVATAYGKANEVNVSMAYEVYTGNIVEECGFFEYEDWLGASPDELVEEDGLSEFKAPYSLRKGGIYKTLSEQPHYYDQIQTELLCTKRVWCDFVQWSPVLELYIERVFVDHKWREVNIPKLKAFHALYLSEIDNKEHLEPLRRNITNLDAIRLAEEYDDLKEAIENAKQRQEEIKEDLILMAGGSNAQIANLKLTKVTKKGSVSYAKVVKEHCPEVDLKKYTGESSKYWKLS